MKALSQNKTAVIGAGSWGTALAVLLAGKGEEVCLWGHNASHLEQLAAERQNARYLPGVAFPDTLQACTGLAETIQGARVIVMVIPSHGYRQVYRRIVPLLASPVLLVSAVKGIEIATRMTMTQVMAEETPGDTRVSLGVLSGPSFAEEVVRAQPTAVTVAFAEEQAALEVQQLFSTEYFRTYRSSDVLGIELCGAMKNVIAIAAGISDGLGFGLNTRAALITRGLAEMTRLGVAMGADPATFAGLGGLGDLVLTCTGNLSRNRSVGLKLGSGKTLDQVLEEMTMVAEGVKTTKSCYNLARDRGVEMPILEQVYQVIYEDKPCSAAVQALFSRDLKQETS
ncbi:NAD(P)H-dependent glycerol-3-phosphate dehydrogenase [Desulfogranum mediterraneum]|uniref:NAD(P)H-dependent glycerol-3-phosphate dehydrogenase n=1 Tax=Desulfogranum mediterraneum TaxID=160661 RepID=UPI00041920CC|nr:NAD(P)H-dependent glycerol-3-phosphate dehydrogenase [Desulfogranum mediterraneum]